MFQQFRRRFLKSGTAAIAGGMLTTPVSGGAPSSLAVERVSRLFPLTPARVIVDIQVTGNRITLLTFDHAAQATHLEVLGTDGSILTQITLPRGRYASAGLGSSGLWVRAIHSTEKPAAFPANSILHFDPNGGMQVIETLDASTASGQVFMHDDYLLHISKGKLSAFVMTSRGLVSKGRFDLSDQSFMNFDAISTSEVAFTRKSGASVASVHLEKGLLSENAIVAPTITAAINKYAPQVSSTSGDPVVIPATGSDAKGELYALVLPSPRSAVPCIKCDKSGNGAVWATLQFPQRGKEAAYLAPLKLKVYPTELAIYFADGAVAWYSTEGAAV